nr:class I SAM-dependent methyltransferase [Ramlibacter aurantiacus]
MRELYDGYFSSHEYGQRYPRPNPGTLRFLLRHGAGGAARVLDLGCGNGRYALALVEAGAQELLGCDISQAALAEFAQRLQGHPAQARVRLLAGGAEALPPNERFDCLLMLFGVLSHIGPRQLRLDTLRQLRAVATPGARLLLSVPSLWRRRPLELLRSLAHGQREQLGDIEFQRRICRRDQTLAYHLYTAAGLRHDLRDAGWTVQAMEAESLVPEWLLTQHPAIGRFDAALQPWLPAALGYGIRAVARPTVARSDLPCG